MSTAGGESSSGGAQPTMVSEETEAARVVSEGGGVLQGPSRGGGKSGPVTVHRKVVTAMPDDFDLRDLL